MNDIEQRIAALEQREFARDGRVAKLEYFLHGNGKPGLLDDLQLVRFRVSAFVVGWILAMLVFGAVSVLNTILIVSLLVRVESLGHNIPLP